VPELDLSIVGKKSPEKIYEYKSKDVILYALGIGAQISDLQFIYEGVPGGLKVFPSFATIPKIAAFPKLGKISFPRLIHGEELVRLYKLFPPQGKIICFSEVTSIYDKGKAAVINVTFTGLSKDRAPLFGIFLQILVLRIELLRTKRLYIALTETSILYTLIKRPLALEDKKNQYYTVYVPMVLQQEQFYKVYATVISHDLKSLKFDLVMLYTLEKR